MNYRLINYFDVWGNEKDGFEVNNLCVEKESIDIKDDASDKEILQVLVDEGFLVTSDRRKVCLVDYGMGDMIEICAKKSMYPLGRLELIQ